MNRIFGWLSASIALSASPNQLTIVIWGGDDLPPLFSSNPSSPAAPTEKISSESLYKKCFFQPVVSTGPVVSTDPVFGFTRAYPPPSVSLTKNPAFSAFSDFSACF
jgi:hypothetical protein